MSSPSPSTHPEIPDYKLIRPIGRGGYGEVWLARSLTGQYRAVKVLWRSRFPNEQPLEREFRGLTEFSAVSLQARRQLALLHVGRNDAAGFLYYVMELADDAAREAGNPDVPFNPDGYVPLTLAELRRRKGRVPAAEVFRLGLEVSEGLAELHRRGLVHRDIKPSNIILVDGLPKLADIGLVASASESLTQLGTPGYMPKEGLGTPMADTYALGRVLYELVTGLDCSRYPQLPADLESLPDWRGVLELNALVLRACDGDPTRRFPSALEMVEELRLLQAGRSVRRLRHAERRLVQLRVVVTALIALVALAGLAMVLDQYRQQRDRRLLYPRDMDAAMLALEAGKLREARQFLVPHLPRGWSSDGRGVEWRILWEASEGTPARALDGLMAGVESLRFSPDGQWLAASDAQGWFGLWAIADGTLRWRANLGGRLLGFMGRAPWVVGLGDDGNAFRVEAETGRRDESWRGPQGMTGLIADSSVAYGSHEQEWFLWDLERASPLVGGRIPDDAGRTLRLLISDSGHWCAVVQAAREAGYLLRVRRADGSQPGWDKPLDWEPTAIVFSKDERGLFVLLGERGQAFRVNVDTGLEEWTAVPLANADTVFGAANSPTGDALFVGGKNGRGAILESRSGEVRWETRSPVPDLWSVAWSPDGSILAAGGVRGLVRLFSAASPPPRNRRGGLWRGVGDDLAVSWHGRLLAITGEAGNVEVLESASLGTRSVLPGALRPLGFVGEEQLWTHSGKATFQRWELDGSPRLAESISEKGTGGIPHASAVSGTPPDWLAVGYGDGVVSLVHVPSRRQIRTQTGVGEVLAVAFAPGGGSLWVGGRSGDLVAVETENGDVQLRKPMGTSVFSIAAPMDGKRVYVGDANFHVHALSVPGLRPYDEPWEAVGNDVTALALASDGSRVVSGDAAGVLRFYDPQNGQVMASFALPHDQGKSGSRAVYSLRFSGNGSVLAGLSADARVHIWHAGPAASTAGALRETRLNAMGPP